MFLRLQVFNYILPLFGNLSHSFFERKFCKELRTYTWKANLLPDIVSCQKTRISDVQFFLTKREHILVTNKEREAANVFSNNKLCHLSLLLQEKHFKSRNAFKSWMYHVAHICFGHILNIAALINIDLFCKNTYSYIEPFYAFLHETIM